MPRRHQNNPGDNQVLVLVIMVVIPFTVGTAPTTRRKRPQLGAQNSNVASSTAAASAGANIPAAPTVTPTTSPTYDHSHTEATKSPTNEHPRSFLSSSFTKRDDHSHQSIIKVNTLKGEVVVKPEYVVELNEMISRYLLALELEKRERKDENMVNIMETIKLLIAQSWIRILSPDPSWLSVEESNIETLLASIEQDIVYVRNNEIPIVDAIITYKKEIEPTITEAFEKKRKHFENVDNIFKKHLKVAKEAKNEIEMDHLKSSWEGIYYSLNQINDNLVVHRILAHRMYIHAYMLNFVNEVDRPTDKITLISTNAETHHKFKVPVTKGLDMFSDILLGDPEEVDRITLNGRISHYLKFFDAEMKTTVDSHLKQSMDTIKHLIVLGWIDNMDVPSVFLLPEHKHKNKEDITRILMQINDHRVKDSILLYTKEKERSIKVDFEREKNILIRKHEKISGEIKPVPTPQQTEELNKIEHDVNELQDYLVAHDIVKHFYLHGYKKTFVHENSESDTFEIRSTTGESKSFTLTAINFSSFYKKPIFD